MKPYNRPNLPKDRRVLSHGLYQHKRGKRPSMAYNDRANPQTALAHVAALFVRDHFINNTIWANHMIEQKHWDLLRETAKEYNLGTEYYPAEGMRGSDYAIARSQNEFGDAVLSNVKCVVCRWFRRYSSWFERELSSCLREMPGSPRLT